MLRIGLTMGDPAGIGPEIVARLLMQPDVLRGYAVSVHGYEAVLADAFRLLGVDVKELEVGFLLYEPPPYPELPMDELPPMGRPSLDAGRMALESLDLAILRAKRGDLDALVTAPLSKEAVALYESTFVGHTEYLAWKFECEDQVGMLLQVDDLRVLHVTTHVPLYRAIDRLSTPKILAKIRQAWESSADLGLSVRRVGVMGLNPHAGEHGLFGDEEQQIIAPAIELARAEGIDAVGPLPPDTALVRARKGEFGIVVAMYHDQGHIPLKLIGWDRGVNITLGLPIPRTSPDHGTAWEIAGKGIADPGSMLEAWRVACSLAAGPKCYTGN